MKNPVANAVSKAFSFLLGLFFYALTVAMICLIVLWETGFVKTQFPALYCLLTREKQNVYLKVDEDTVAFVHTNNNCSCDTTFYHKSALKDTLNETPTNP